MPDTYQEQAQAEMWRRVSRADELRERAPPPTAKQIYILARVLAERMDLQWPETCDAASILISRLRCARAIPPKRSSSTYT
jgi:hypothetical protein